MPDDRELLDTGSSDRLLANRIPMTAATDEAVLEMQSDAVDIDGQPLKKKPFGFLFWFALSFLVVVLLSALLANVLPLQKPNFGNFSGKYYFHRVAGGQPFAGAGFSFRTIGIESSGYSVTGTGAAPVYTPFDSHYRAELAVGAVAAAGLRYKVGRFSVVPQIRYTRWGSGDSLSRKNAFGAFLGVTF